MKMCLRFMMEIVCIKTHTREYDRVSQYSVHFVTHRSQSVFVFSIKLAYDDDCLPYSQTSELTVRG